MTEDLRRLGIREGDTLLVHSSFKALGWENGSPEQVLAALQQAVGPEGTLLVPTLTYATVTPQHPFFDVRHTAPCVGAIPTAFCGLPGVYRSLSPTHSIAALGRLAERLTEGQELDNTPVGGHSALRRLRDWPQMDGTCGGKILMLGCGLCPNTSMHGIEELVGVPYVLQEQETTFTCVDRDGKEHAVRMRCHDFYYKGRHLEQHYERLLPLLDPTEWQQGQVLQAPSILLSAAAVWEHAESKLRTDPWYFVE